MPLPEAFKFAKSVLDSLKRIPGDKYCEYEMGLTQGLQPCGFRDPDVWFRGIADLLIINTEIGEARVVDYKTGKSAKYADVGQLELMALAVFKHFPQVQEVDAALFFVIAKAFIRREYKRDEAPGLWAKWLKRYGRILTAIDTGVWNPKPTPLCGWCPVKTCEYNKPRRN